MRHALALLAAAALSLTGCVEDPVPNQTTGDNLLEAGENAIWNDLATVPAEENVAADTSAPEVEAPRAKEAASEPAPAKAPNRETPMASEPKPPEPKAEAEPDPHAGHDMNEMNGQ